MSGKWVTSRLSADVSMIRQGSNVHKRISEREEAIGEECSTDHVQERPVGGLLGLFRDAIDEIRVFVLSQ